MNTICRVCLQSTGPEEVLDTQLIYDEDDQLSYAQCFTVCTNIYLPTEQRLGRPHTLCRNCGLELQIAYDFRKKVELSKRYFCNWTPNTESVTNHNPIFVSCDEEEITSIKAFKIKKTNESVSTSSDETAANDPLITLEKQNCIQSNMTMVHEENGEEIEEFLEIETEADQEEVVEQEDDEDNGEEGISIVECMPDDKMFYVVECLPTPRRDTIGDDSTISWQTAVVTVANEEHLPVGNSNDAGSEEHEENEQNDDTIEEETIEVTHEKYEWYDENEIEVHKVPKAIMLTRSKSRSWKSTEVDEMTITNDIDDAMSSEDIVTTSPEIIISTTVNRKRFTGKFSCSYCHKIYPNHSRMVAHRRSHEPDRPRFPCAHCDRIYATKQAMEVHERSVHTKTSVYDCSICGKVYAIKKGLEVHMRYHTGTFPYACELCDRKFAQRSHLNTHRNVKHNSERFACEHPNCGKFFTSSASLRNHEFSHGAMPFECEFCNHGYPAKSKLKVHIRRKHGQEMTMDQLEHMRKFHVMRSKLNLVKVVEHED